MSGGRKKKQDDIVGPNVVTLDQEEFNEVCKRVHAFLLNRAEKARERKEKKPSRRSLKNHIETSKEVFVFVHLLELVENMTEEITDLRGIITSVSPDDEEPTARNVPELFTTNKKRYLN